MKAWGIVLLAVVIVLLALLIRRDLRESVRLSAARDTIQVIEHQRDTVRDTIRVREKAKARVDTMVQALTDTQLVIRESPSAPPETVTVRAPIVERIRTDSALLSSLYTDRRLDSLWHIQDAKFPHTVPRKWSLGLAAGYGCSSKGCGPAVTVGLTWRP